MSKVSCSSWVYWLALVDQRHRQALKDLAAMNRRYQSELEDAIVDGMVAINDRMKGCSDEQIAEATCEFLRKRGLH